MSSSDRAGAVIVQDLADVISKHRDVGDLYFQARLQWLKADASDDAEGRAAAERTFDQALDLAATYRGAAYTGLQRDALHAELRRV